MALANIACLLAARESSDSGQPVLMIDWDLEAPGLHRFFRNRFEGLFSGEEDPENELEQSRGLLDLFIELRDSVTQSGGLAEVQTEDEAASLIKKCEVGEFILRTDIPNLFLLKAGRFDHTYAERVNSFDWERLYNSSPWLILSFARYLAEHYSYVLIDSRTGVTDVSGICTMLMPDKLVAVFTPNRQSLFGLENLIKRAAKYRRESDDLRPLVVFPLASRIEPTEPNLRKYWRFGDKEQDIPGYQPLFQRLFEDIYQLSECDLSDYFRDVQLQHVPHYAYGEDIAVLHEDDPDRLSLPMSYHTVVNRLIDSRVPWMMETMPEAKAAPNVRAEEAYSRLSPEHHESARRIFGRLVRLPERRDGGLDTRRQAARSEFNPEDLPVLDELWKGGLLVVDSNPSHAVGPTVEIAEERLIHQWNRLKNWLSDDRDFLLRRQALAAALTTWADRWQDEDALLTGDSLKAAVRLLKKNNAALSSDEKQYIHESLKFESRRRFRKRLILWAPLAILTALLVVVISLWKSSGPTADVYLDAGNGLLEKGKYDEAIEKYEQALRLNPRLVDVYDHLGKAYELKDDDNKAREYYLKALEYDSNNVAAYESLGMLSHKSGDYDQAIKYFLRAIEAVSDKSEHFVNTKSELFVNIGESYRYNGQLPQAVDSFNKAIELTPEAAKPHLKLGVALFQQGDYSRAIENFNKASGSDVDEVQMRYNRALAYAAKKMFGEATSDLDWIIVSTKGPNKSLAPAYLKRGDIRVELWRTSKDPSDFRQATGDYNRAIQSDPNSPEVYFKKGLIFQLEGDYSAATYCFKLAILQNSAYYEAYMQLGLSFLQVGRNVEAIAPFTMAIGLRPDSIEAHFNRAVAYKAKGDKDNAVADFKFVVRAVDNPGLQEKARLSLRAMDIYDDTARFKTTIDLHSANATDSGVIDQIQTALQAKGYQVQRIPPGGQAFAGVRYFNKEDKQNAMEIQDIAKEIVGRQNSTVALAVGHFHQSNVRVGKIELWIPALSLSNPPK